MHKKHKPKATSYFLYGKHACLAAINNPKRDIKQILVTQNAAHDLQETLPRNITITDKKKLEKLLPDQAVHQGIAVEVSPLPTLSLEDIADILKHQNAHIVILDQITDPHNVGAILRSAAAFDMAAVCVMKHAAPTENATLAKAASGALETIPMVTLTNLNQAIATLKQQNFWVFGLDGSAQDSISIIKEGKFDHVALILGAEGKGLRKLTKEHCDKLVKIPMSDKVESLNVSNAATLAMYGCK